MASDEDMKRPENIPEERWKQHLDWMQVTGSTVDQHLKEHQSGELWEQFQRRAMTRQKQQKNDK